MSEHERRVFPRYELLAQLSVRDGAVDHVLEILNLSRGGALVDLGSTARPRWLELHRAVEARLFDADGHVLLEAMGRVVRIAETLEHRTFAIQFDTLLDEHVVRSALRAVGRPPPLPGRASEGN